ncbi:hypothetical protein B296_00025391 [Ensete ventricosum]|uniref:Uncharacterized protein n=1 Tax=Ensete ventricosum TaxID=4639 RepID=A0A427AC92_ENSVE|nr:hypothetical protein B296_00025391 [Ensete ventricosum]
MVDFDPHRHNQAVSAKEEEGEEEIEEKGEPGASKAMRWRLLICGGRRSLDDVAEALQGRKVTVPSMASVYNEYAMKSQFETSIYLQVTDSL